MGYALVLRSKADSHFAKEKAPWPDSEFRTPRLIEHAENLKTEQLHKLDDKSASKANGDENGTSSDEEKPRSPKDVKLDADLKTLLRGEKGKKVPYSHRWGQTPYPDFQCPPIEQYYLVNDLLSKLHGPKNAPAAIPPPSEGYSLCGETECVIDAMMRTLLSANTRGDSGSSRTIQKMIETFGTTKEGSEEACIDWDLVRRSPVERIESTIKGGGEQEKKAKAIKEILDMVKWRNDIRRHALSDPSFAAEHNIDNTSAIQLSAAICLSDPTALSLDYLRALPYHAAFDALLKYPQIALKTASCVMLYCFQQPSFAVDTHVQRITGWLGWRPKGDDENKTFRHLEGVIPDELKYSLHTLFVVHGKECVRCAEKTHKGSPGWEKGCVLEGLIEERVKKRDGKVKVDPKQRKMDGFVMRRVGKGEVKAEESQSSLEKSDTAMMEDRLAGEDEEA